MTTKGKRACLVRYQPASDGDARREARALSRSGFDVTLVCVGTADEPRWERSDGYTIRRFRVPKRRGGLLAYVGDYSIWFVVCACYLTKEHLRRPFSIIQVSTLPDFQVFTAAIPKLLGCRVVLFFKEPAAELVMADDGPAVLVRAMRRVTRLAARFADVVLTVTQQHRQIYLDLGVPAERVHVVENTPPPDLLPTAVEAGRRDHHEVDAGHPLTVIMHGTIEERYGHDTLLEATALCVARGLPIRLLITGRGTWAPELQRRIDSLGLRDVVDYRGWVSEAELAELLDSADVGVVAQHRSAYSDLVHTLKMYEYMHAGIPVVASELSSAVAYFGPCLEWFAAGDAGSLAEALIRLAADPARRADLAHRASKAYEEYSWPLLERRYLDVVLPAA